MHCYVQARCRMIGELWLRTMARINSTVLHTRDTCSTQGFDRSETFFDLLESDVLCPRIPWRIDRIKKQCT